MSVNFESNFFTLLELLEPGSRIEVEGACTKITVPPNEIIYKQGDPSSSVYIVASGRVEAFTQSPDGRRTRSLGFMGKGEFFGEIGVLTGQDRLAGVRTCEPTKLLQIEKLSFIRVLEKVPKVGAFFTRNLARRLHQTSTQAHVNIYSLDLTGNLLHFDLLTILLAITATLRSGELLLNNAHNELIGGFYFHEGQIRHARFLHLLEAEAVWESFVHPGLDGTFSFRVMTEQPAQFTDETKVEIESASLLHYGNVCRETYAALPESLRKMEGRLNRLTEMLTWDNEETQAHAARIWEWIAKRPQTLDSLWRRLNVSTLTFLQIVSVMVDHGLANVIIDPPTTPLTDTQSTAEKFGAKTTPLP